MSKRHIEISDGTARRLIRIGGTLTNGIELASFAPSVDALIKAKDAFLNPSSVEHAQPKPAEASKPTGRPRTRPFTVEEAIAAKTEDLLAHGYPQHIASDMSAANIARCEAEIAAGKSPKQFADLKAAWSDE